MALSVRATLETLGLMVAVFVVQLLLLPLVALGIPLFAIPGDFPAFLLTPWTWVLSVYAHGGLGHLVGNAVMLLLVGIGVERVTTRWRFHLFFVTTGAIAGLSHVVFHTLVPTSRTLGVLGASGAIFALLGYLLAGNRITDELVAGFELDLRAQLAAIGVVGAALTLAFFGIGVANVGHFAGVLLGLLAGRMKLLHVE